MAMMKIFFLLAVALLASPTLFAGDITGTVRAEPKAGTEQNSAATSAAYSNRKLKFAQRVDYSAMKDFVVGLEGKIGTNAMPTNIVEVTTTRIAQRGAVFTPHILPVVAGTTVEWPNNDDIFHNVFSDSDAKKFDLDLYKGNPPDKRVTFDRAGKVDVYCSIHADMHCIVLVMENPYFAVADAEGNFTITNVPPGTYKLKAWHERLPADEQEITVPTNGVVRADFVMTIKNLPKY
jgi:plastocyanin